MTYSDEQFRELVEQAGEFLNPVQDGPALGRRHTRFDVPGLVAKVTVYQTGAQRTESVARLIDVSAGGCKIIYPGFLHNETELRLAVTSRSGGTEHIIGHVAWCRFLSGKHHLVGIATDDAIDVRPFVDPETWAEHLAKQSKQPEFITSPVVCFSDESLTKAALELHLSAIAKEYRVHTGTGQFFDALRKGEADAVLIDVDSDALSALDLITETRGTGFRGPIVLLSEDPEAEGILHLDPERNASFLQKPIRERTLFVALLDSLEDVHARGVLQDPIYSDVPRVPNRSEVLTVAIERFRELINDAFIQTEAEDFERVRKTLQLVHTNAESLGYSALVESASSCLSDLADEQRRRRLSANLTRLMGTAARLSADLPPDLSSDAA